MIDVVIYSVFILALIAFSLSPAIYITNKLSNKFIFIENNSTKISILLQFYSLVLGHFYILVLTNDKLKLRYFTF